MKALLLLIPLMLGSVPADRCRTLSASAGAGLDNWLVNVFGSAATETFGPAVLKFHDLYRAGVELQWDPNGNNAVASTREPICKTGQWCYGGSCVEHEFCATLVAELTGAQESTVESWLINNLGPVATQEFGAGVIVLLDVTNAGVRMRWDGGTAVVSSYVCKSGTWELP